MFYFFLWQTMDPQGGRVVRYTGGINFANRGHFKNRIFKLLNIDPKKMNYKPNSTGPDMNKVYSLESIEKVSISQIPSRSSK